MCDGCCGARLLVVPYVAYQPCTSESNNHALDHFLNLVLSSLDGRYYLERLMSVMIWSVGAAAIFWADCLILGAACWVISGVMMIWR